MKQQNIDKSEIMIAFVKNNHEAILKGIKKSLHPNGKGLLQFGGEGIAKEILEVMEVFIAGFVEAYLELRPLDDEGRVHVNMVRSKMTSF